MNTWPGLVLSNLEVHPTHHSSLPSCHKTGEEADILCYLNIQKFPKDMLTQHSLDKFILPYCKYLDTLIFIPSWQWLSSSDDTQSTIPSHIWLSSRQRCPHWKHLSSVFLGLISKTATFVFRSRCLTFTSWGDAALFSHLFDEDIDMNLTEKPPRRCKRKLHSSWIPERDIFIYCT
jgi:hypothetical protein